MKKRLPFLFLTLSFISFSTVHAELFEEAADVEARVTRFAGAGVYQSLLQLEKEVPGAAKVAVKPWSGNYWPLVKGGPAHPFMEKRGDKKNFDPNYDHFKDRLPDLQRDISRNKLKSKDQARMSPTEKYDLYLGDHDFSLTRAVWQSLYELDKIRKKKIKDWEGMCHGWSGASAYSKRPRKPVTLKSLDGRYDVTFYPDDLKALSTLLWANSLIQDSTIMEGVRCKTGAPYRDEESGKVLTLRCKGVNPAVFHLAVLGLVGKRGASFILNKNNDEEIWNQPVAGYQYNYYNIKTGLPADLKNAVIQRTGFNDPFVKFRSKKAAYMVGVDMTVDYAEETDPSQQEHDGEENDKVEKIHMRYDLELDADFKPVGGEWVDDEGAYGSNENWIPNYPAFIWRFTADYPHAASIVDMKTPDPRGGLSSSSIIPLSREAASFRYQRVMIDESGELDKLLLDEEGKVILAQKELRPQPIGKLIYWLLDLAQ